MLRSLFIILLASSQLSAQLNFETVFEKSGYLSTSNYSETVEYFQNLEGASEYARLINIGISPQGRELKCLIVSKDEIFESSTAKSLGKSIILINNGIHSGEIEGKDASMIMLREMLITKEKESLLDNVVLLVIPVFNIDGHERSSPFNRINQNGPTEMGWRTTAQNLNLNRDFAKADAPEMKSFLKLYSEWLPDIFIDNHTTDGADYQYTITYGISKNLDIPPLTRQLVREEIIPKIEKDVSEKGFLISPFVGFIDGDYNNGIREWVAGPRYSNGYGSAQNRIGLLIETHMLKPYKERVFSTKALMESVIEYFNDNNIIIRETLDKADEYSMKKYSKGNSAFPLNYKLTEDYIKYNYKGFKKIYKESFIAGKKIVKYSKEKTEKIVPYYEKVKVSDSVFLPIAYFIPSEWKNLMDIMELHGISGEIINEKKSLIAERMKFKDVSFAKHPYEGRFIPKFNYDIQIDTVTANPGDYIIHTDQRSIKLIAHLLEPKSADSFVKWGFMNVIFERKEYFEEYSIEPIAQRMYDESAYLRNEFNYLLENDSTFANSPRKRLNYFYERSPYNDEKHNMYPILRVNKIIE